MSKIAKYCKIAENLQIKIATFIKKNSAHLFFILDIMHVKLNLYYKMNISVHKYLEKYQTL